MKSNYRFLKLILSILALNLTIDLALWTSVAEARLGGGRSSGRGSSFRSSPSRSARPNSSYQRNTTPPPSQSQRFDPQPARGGFLRGLAGGIAGGFLGSMLFSSLGHAGTGFGGGMGGFGGGMGFLEILLLVGIAWIGFRMWRNRQRPQATPVDYPVYERSSSAPYATSYAPSSSTIDREIAEDIFFRLQGAWTRRDLGSVREHVADEFRPTLEQDLAVLKRQGQINRLENISIRDIEIGESWQENGAEFVSVRFTANLLDYTVDERTQAVVSGNDRVPVKFIEDWTFKKTSYSERWQLAGIDQPTDA